MQKSFVSPTVSLVALCLFGFGCGVGDPGEITSNRDGVPSFSEFEASTWQEPESGVYIVNGDEAIADLKALREFYDRAYGTPGALIVHAPGGVVAKWSSTQRKNIRFCISNSFGARKARVLQAMSDATLAWENAADVLFIYASDQDAACNAQNGNVVFDVRPTSGQPYLARAFFPNQGRSQRNVLIDSTAFGNLGAVTLTGILRHELGHTLGFRHEHTRPESGKCFEDNAWAALTPYDSASVMHYPQCNGTGVDLSLTSRDVSGAQALYGAPGGGGGQNPPPTPGQGTPHQDSASGTLAAGQEIDYQPISVTPGTQLVAQMTGTGDADLYIRFGAALGLCSGSEARVLFYATVAEVIIPGLERAGLAAQAAWDRRRQS
jgi:serine protease